MALLAQGFDPSGYTPDYSVANRANEQLFQNQQQGLQNISKGIEDYAKQQKDLAQKDKEMAAKIKGTMSLLDNAKGIYTEFAPQIDAMKVQLADPSISNLDKAALSDSVTNSLNMFATQGTEGVKRQLMEAQIAQAKAQTEAIGLTPMTGVVNGKTVEGVGNARTGEFTPYTSGKQPSQFKSTAFGRSSIDPTTKKEVESGQFKKMNGDENVGSGGIQYSGPTAQTPTIATKAYPAGTRLIITSDLYPQGREHIVAGTGPSDPNALDFFADTKEEYNKLANQKISNVQVVDGRSQAISNASQMLSAQPAAGTADLIAGSQLVSGIGQQGQPVQQGQPATEQMPTDNTVGVAPRPTQVLTPEQQRLQQLDIEAREVQIAENIAKKAEIENNVELKSRAEENKKYSTIKALKNTYDQILEAKNNPQIRQAFGVPVGMTSTGLPGGMITSRLIPGTGASDARAKVDSIVANSWVKSVIDAKAQGATFGALSNSEGEKLAQAATLLASADRLTYDTANREMQNMLEGLKESYKRLTGSDLTTSTEVPAQTKTASPATAAQSRIDALF